MTYEPVWGAIIAWYLFLAGLGGGAFITSALASWLYPKATTVRKMGRLIGLVTVCVGLALLMLDARAGFAHPWRFALLLEHLDGSVMSWGVVFLAAFMIIALAVVIVEICDTRFRAADPSGVWAHKHPQRAANGVKVPEWLNILGVIFAFAVAAYTGALLGVVKTFPLWNHPLLPVLFTVSALSTGIASVVFFGLLFARNEVEQLVNIKRTHFGLVCGEILLVFFMLFVLVSQSSDAHDTVMRLLCGDYAIQFWLLFVALGLVLPLIADGWELFCPSKKSAGALRGVGLASEVGVMVGGYFLRYLVIVAALPAGFAAGLVF
jgi:polysulfide reductase chain C